MTSSSVPLLRDRRIQPGERWIFAAGFNVKQTAAGIPLGRVSGPDDAAQAVLYLCSAAASYITGTSLAVDGGNSIGSLVVHQAKQNPL